MRGHAPGILQRWFRGTLKWVLADELNAEFCPGWPLASLAAIAATDAQFNSLKERCFPCAVHTAKQINGAKLEVPLLWLRSEVVAV